MKLWKLMVSCVVAAFAAANGSLASACPHVAVPLAIQAQAHSPVLLSAVETAPVEVVPTPHVVVQAAVVRPLIVRRSRVGVRALRVLNLRRAVCR